MDLNWLFLLLILIIIPLAYVILRHLLVCKINYAGKHVLVSGGSKGLGKSIAEHLVKRGAHVTILARNDKDLASALSDLEKLTVVEGQMINSLKTDVTDHLQARNAVEQAFAITKIVPSIVFTCAGASLPGLFLEQDLAEYKKGMDLNYVGTVNIIQPAVQQMAKHAVEGRVVMISSVLGLFGLIGYSQYVPTKFALRGLAETLRQELMPKNIKVHIMFPATIFTPGFDHEQTRKPEITKIIEGADEGQTPDVVATKLLTGLDYGNFFISSDPIGHLLRCLNSGLAPFNDFVVDPLSALIAVPVFFGWRIFVQSTVSKYYKSR